MNSLDLSLDTDVVECNGVISGNVRWDGLEKAPRQIFVELLYRTEGRGDTDKEVLDQVVLPGEVTGSHGFRLRVPKAGPISYEGKLIRVLWEVQARVDVKMAKDPRVAASVAVLPHGGIVLWKKHADPEQLAPPSGQALLGPDESPFEPPSPPGINEQGTVESRFEPPEPPVVP